MRLDQLGKDPGQIGPDSTGQCGSPQYLSSIEDSANEASRNLPTQIKLSKLVSSKAWKTRLIIPNALSTLTSTTAAPTMFRRSIPNSHQPLSARGLSESTADGDLLMSKICRMRIRLFRTASY
jgi:hypothetical protein